ncbi:Sodium-dependent dopamine transporter [Armadillidium vulgare]|nr:Sodium-dependent dopamine transporter [Armadillidium vulgare]
MQQNDVSGNVLRQRGYQAPGCGTRATNGHCNNAMGPFLSFAIILFYDVLKSLVDSRPFAGSEAVVTALSDEFPVIGRNREIFVACLFAFDFLVGLACCTQGGYYVFQVFETYAAGISILFAVFCEAIAIAYIYGIPRLFEDVKEMIGFSPGIYWRTSIKYFGPFFIGRIRYLCIPWRDQQVTTSNGVTVDSDQVKLNSPIGNAHQK